MTPGRLLLLRIIVLGVFLIFAGTLLYVQLGRGAELRRLSEQNHLRWVRTPAPRGRILDRHHRPLATSIPALSAWLVSGEVPTKRWDEMLQCFTDLGIYPDLKTASEELAEYRRFPGYVPVRLISGLSIKDPRVTRIEEELPYLPGVYMKVEPVRYYPLHALAAHALGYQLEINAEELKSLRAHGYRLGDRLGKTGIERAFEEELRGRDGGEQVEVDARGSKLREAANIPPAAGDDLTLTIDENVQQAAEEGLRGHRGAVVALDPATGDILAIASAPAFDLNGQSGHRDEFNRAVRGQYPPGSVFKIVTAAAALECGAIKPGTTFYCDGSYKGIHCWQHRGHGALNLTGAMAHSCNVYFMHAAERVGDKRLAEMARRFGLGHAVDIDGVLSGKAGLVPDAEWAKSRRNGRWELGETLQMGIGQSALTVTPLQSAGIAAAIANGGYFVQPRLVLAVGDKDRHAKKGRELGLRPETLAAIERALKAVAAEGGTAGSLDPTLRIAGKTGTAQNPGGVDHAWFAGYAPYDHPTIAVAVLVENGGHGGAVAAPIAQAVIRAAANQTP